VIKIGECLDGWRLDGLPSAPGVSHGQNSAMAE
jgi:hypothetical protein